jgi:hypothetical protein
VRRTAPEKQWETECAPIPLLQLVDGRLRDVHYRRCASAWCQLVRPLLTSDTFLGLAEQVEQVASRDIPAESMARLLWGPDGGSRLPYPTNRAEETIRESVFRAGDLEPGSEAEYYRWILTRVSLNGALAWASARVGPSPPDVRPGHRWHQDYNAAAAEAREAQAHAVRCVLGNPFRPVVFDPSWQTSTAVALARQMYDSRDFSGMPILADALQDAGCEDAAVLAHCRGPGPHVRGCWVVDLVLGRA